MKLPFVVPDGVQLVLDVEPAGWVLARLLPRDRSAGVRVGEVVPTGFEAYARIFHPAREEPTMTSVRWSTLARRNGRTVHPEMQLEHLVGSLEIHRVPDLEAPEEGRLPRSELETLVDVLGAHTAPRDLTWFAVWEGFGIFGAGLSTISSTPALYASSGESLRARGDRERAERQRARRAEEQLAAIPKLEIGPSSHGAAFRAYLVFRGPIDRASKLAFNGWEQSPNLWWPDDRSWCVATEVDGYSTYVGGSAACIEAILRDDRLESLPSDPDNRFDLWSDRINPAPPGMGERWGD
jgi:hypothetical protein